MKKVVGYSFWGFLSDVKIDKDGNELSTPDGNAFYSWSILRELEKRGYDVVQVMPDRDKYAIQKFGKDAFKAWCKEERFEAYSDTKKTDYSCVDLRTCKTTEVFEIFDRMNLKQSEYILHEWRMEISSRNAILSRANPGWQPDLFLQDCLLAYCSLNNIKLVVFDLDYKLSEEEAISLSKVVDLTIIELGDKWQLTNSGVKSARVEIPFCFDCIDYFDVDDESDSKLVYVGNRYERDWCIDKYFPKNKDGCVVYGNWNESGRDSKKKWPTIDFRKRLQTSEMHDAYSSSACTLLLAKSNYCKYGFMTARVIESIFYGAIPLFIEEFGEDLISKYAGALKDCLTVRSEEDVTRKMNFFYDSPNYVKKCVILYLRDRLEFMDAKNFVDDVENAIKI